MYAHWILLLILLPCSGLISGSETALFGLSRLEMREFASASGALRHRAWLLMQRPRRVLLTVLVANTAVNVLFFAISFVVLEDIGHRSSLAASAGGVVALLVMVIFGEILPKAVARAHAARLAPLAAPIIQTMQVALGPVQTILQVGLVEPLTRLLGGSQPDANEVTVDELRSLVELSAHQGVIGSAESRMLQGIVVLPEIKVRLIMRPRVDVVAAGLDESPDQVRRKLRDAHLTKLPVYGRDLDDVRGMIRARDLFLNRAAPVAQLMQPVQFVPEQAHLLQLIEHFRRHQSRLAIVVDEYGGMAGLVTLHDVLEEIVGEVAGTGQSPDPATEVIDQNTYRLAGDLSIRDWAERFGLSSLPATTRFQTVAGLVLAELGRVPREGDAISIQNLTLTVERLDGHRIDRILLTRNRPEAGS